MRNYRRKFAPDWVRTHVTNEERAAVWELVAGGHNIAGIRKKLELQNIYLDRETISKIIQEAIGEPGIPAELVRTQKPAVQEWIISKRPHIRETLSGAPVGETPQQSPGAGARDPAEREETAEPVKSKERGPGRYRWLRLAGIGSASIALFVVVAYLWPSPLPKPTTAQPSTTTPTQSPTATPAQPRTTTPSLSPTTTPAAFVPGNIVTVAGSTIPLSDGGPATAAQLNGPLGLALDSGNLYIVDSTNNRIRRVDLGTGTITTFAGNGAAGYAGDGGPGTAAQLSAPVGVAVDSGNLYIADFGNNRVRRVDLATGTITTFAGGGSVPTGDGGPATAAQINGPFGLAVDSANLYIGDTGNNRVRRVDLATGIITTIAGTGVTGFAGDGGPATAAQLSVPRGLALGSGNLYIGDVGNHRVRRVDLVTGTITTFAGNGAVGSGGDGGPAAAAQLNFPGGLAVGSGNLYIAERNNNRVRRVDLK